MAEIADIYIRVSSKEQTTGGGLARQEEIGRSYAAGRGFTIRNVIQDVGSAGTNVFRTQKHLFAAYDRWRKGYWKAKGEPLSARECPARVVPEPPPNFLVLEDWDRFSRRSVEETLFRVLLFESIGIRIVTCLPVQAARLPPDTPIEIGDIVISANERFIAFGKRHDA